MKCKVQKKSFLLLEVLIAFTLVLCFTFPFIKSPIHFFASEKKKLNAIVLERVANYGFTEILTKIYQNDIKWNDIQTKNKQHATFFYLEDYQENDKQLIKRKYRLIRKNTKLSSDNHIYIKLQIDQHLSINKEQYCFSRFVIVKNKTPF